MQNPMMQYLSKGQQQGNTNIQAAITRARNIMQGGGNQTLSSIMALCRGQDPKNVFYSKCKDMGVNPDDILSLLR